MLFAILVPLIFEMISKIALSSQDIGVGKQWLQHSQHVSVLEPSDFPVIPGFPGVSGCFGLFAITVFSEGSATTVNSKTEPKISFNIFEEFVLENSTVCCYKSTDALQQNCIVLLYLIGAVKCNVYFHAISSNVMFIFMF